MLTILRIFLCLGLLCGLGLYACWCALPHFLQDPTQSIQAQTPVRTYYDRYGDVIVRQPTYQGQWSLHVPLSQMSPDVVNVIQAIEDYRFYQHDGIDRYAILRAAWQVATNLRIISGASTISMQLAGSTLPRKRTLMRKFTQAALARKLEWNHSKHWILENYLNRIPFGGNIYGIEAAARMYFGVPATQLTTAEAALLCGLPQRPNALRPDRHPAQAKQRQELILKRLVELNALTPDQAKNLYKKKLHFRDFSLPMPLKYRRLPPTDHALQMACFEAKHATEIHTTLDLHLLAQLMQALKMQTDALPGVHDAAGVVMDNSSGDILAVVGTLDFASPEAGQVNAAISRRCAGSTLKPFVYAEAMDAGMLCPDTVLEDRPIRFGTYSPGNYDGTFRKGVTAEEALAYSLNTPAVRLVAQLSAERALDTFQRLRLQKWNVWSNNQELATKLGLSLVLGTGGYRLTDLAAAYAVFPNKGVFTDAHLVQKAMPPREERPVVFTPGTAALICKMLSSRPMPGVFEGVAWKTGTSTGNQDAWCFAFTPEITVGVWFGNKTGKTAPSLVGATAAAPAIASIMHAYYRNDRPSVFSIRDVTEETRLCAKTGLRAQIGVCQEKNGFTPECIPLQMCRQCTASTPKKTIAILSPKPQTYATRSYADAPVPVARLTLKAVPSENTHWYLDDVYKGPLTPNLRFDFTPGYHTIRVVSESPEWDDAVMNVIVKP